MDNILEEQEDQRVIIKVLKFLMSAECDGE